MKVIEIFDSIDGEGIRTGYIKDDVKIKLL